MRATPVGGAVPAFASEKGSLHGADGSSGTPRGGSVIATGAATAGDRAGQFSGAAPLSIGTAAHTMIAGTAAPYLFTSTTSPSLATSGDASILITG